MNKFEEKVYPFTTESISGYMGIMDVKDKSVLTVGSSIDQALSACLYGAKDITVMDINKMTRAYMKYKLELLKRCSNFDEFYQMIAMFNGLPLSKDEMFSLEALRKMCPYFKDWKSFSQLKENMKDTKFKFIEGNIFDMDNVLIDKKYDRMILSNVLQYIEMYRGEKSVKEFIKDNFEMFLNHINDKGVIQLLYIYAYEGNNKFTGFSTYDFVNALFGYNIEMISFPSGNKSDAVILYEKK